MMWEGDDGGDVSTPAQQMSPGCNASWPWMCSSNPPDEPEDPNESLGEVSGTGEATPDPNSIAPQYQGSLLNYAQDTDPVDGWVYSINGVAASGSHLHMVGFDFVNANGKWVVFLVTPARLGGPPNSLIAKSPHNFSTPQIGVSGTVAPITSEIIRKNPTVTGIELAWSGIALQEGYTVFFVTKSASSSVDANGNPTFETTSSGGGGSAGVPEIIFEYHQYITYAEPIWPR